jgi:hypothetical protein
MLSFSRGRYTLAVRLGAETTKIGLASLPQYTIRRSSNRTDYCSAASPPDCFAAPNRTIETATAIGSPNRGHPTQVTHRYRKGYFRARRARRTTRPPARRVRPLMALDGSISGAATGFLGAGLLHPGKNGRSVHQIPPTGSALAVVTAPREIIRVARSLNIILHSFPSADVLLEINALGRECSAVARR